MAMRRVNTGVRIVSELLKKLDDLSRADGRRTRNQLIEDAISEYVDRHWPPREKSQAVSGAKRFRGDSRISTWLTSIAINVCRGHHRTRLLRASFWKRWMSQRIEARDEDASEPAEQRERVRRVTEAVRRLKRMYREVVVLH